MRLIRPITVDSGNLALDGTTVPETPPAAYNGGTTYAIGTEVSVASGFTYTVYRSLQNGNTGHTPASSPDWWLELAVTYAAYNGATSYSDGDVVISTATHHAYESLVGSNVGNALTDASKWLDLGPTNAYRMFDESNSSQTECARSIEVELAVTGRADAVALLNLVAAEVRIVMTTDDDGVIYDETVSLVSGSGIVDWYGYFFEPIVRRGDLVVWGLPNYGNPTIQITVNEPSGTAKVGVCVVGLSRDLGSLLYGARTGIQDYSRKETDEFGNFTIVQRNYAKRAAFKLVVPNASVDAISSLLASYRAEPIVYVGTDEYAVTWVYGFYRDFAVELAQLEQSYLTLELEGLT